jgi:AraC-like DNA-binding protein
MRIARESVHHPEESLRCMHLELSEFRGVLHRHSHFELTWIQRGQGLRWVGDSVEPFFDGDLVLVGSETPHLWASRAGQRTHDCAATVLQFPSNWAGRTGLPELAAAAPLLVQAACGLEILEPTRREVQRLLLRLPSASPLRRLAVCIDIMGALVDGGGASLRRLSSRLPAPLPTDGHGGPGVRRIDRVLSWIESHLADELRVEDAAAVAHVSTAAFGRFFRREVGKSFTAYVNDARCGWAALRLVQSPEPIAQIAEACGFPTLSNFGEQFRRRHGVSPREFRSGSRDTRRLKPAGKPRGVK